MDVTSSLPLAGELSAPPPLPNNDYARPLAPPVFAPVAGGWLRRLGFRFLTLWLVVFALSRIFGIVPGLGWFSGRMYLMWRTVVPWFGRSVLHLPQPVSLAASGSGDKMFDWVQAAATLSLAAVGALIWVWFDRKRSWDGWARDLSTVAVRYTLGVTMLSYGLSKIFYQQMPAPGFYRLLETYGESSPMGLLWTFMGQSQAYSIFAGGLEFLGGALLFFRRTTTLGALIIFAVMLNVLMMNLCFDVPVKLYSAYYLFLSIVLFAPDMRRLLNVLLLHRPAPAVAVARPWPTRRTHLARPLMMVVKVLIVGWIAWLMPVQRTMAWAATPAVVKSELYGLYEVESFTRNGEVLPPLLTDRVRWRRIAIDEKNYLIVVYMNDLRGGFRLKPGKEPGKLLVEAVARTAPVLKRELAFTRPTPDTLTLDGDFGGAKISVKLKRVDDTKLLLPNRGFHWVSEQPFNR